jgi:hypothetical protein
MISVKPSRSGEIMNCVSNCIENLIYDTSYYPSLDEYDIVMLQFSIINRGQAIRRVCIPLKSVLINEN